MRFREVATRSFDGTGDLVVIAPLKDGFIDAYDSVTYETRARMAAEALHNIRLNAREYEIALPFADTTERILNVLDFRLGVLDKNLFELATGRSAGNQIDDAQEFAKRLVSRRYLFLSVTFDSGWEPYMRLIWKPLGAFLDMFFCNCEGYPPAGDTGFNQYIDWVRKNQVESAIFYSATGLSVADQIWFKNADHVMTDPGHDATLSADLAQMVVQPPTEIAQAFRDRDATLFKSVQVGMEALNVLYKLADLYPVHRHRGSASDRPEGRHLLRATHELLSGFDDVLTRFDARYPPNAAATRHYYREPLAWWEQGKPLLASGATPVADQSCDRSEVQAGILSPPRVNGKSTNAGALLLMTITDPAKAQQFVRNLPVTYEAGPANDNDFVLSIGFTPRGLSSMGMTRRNLESWPQEFRDGMELRSGIVGDKREHHPRNWIWPRRRSPLERRPDATLKGFAVDTTDNSVARPRVSPCEVDFVLQVRLRHDGAGSDDALVAAINAIAGGEDQGVVITACERMSRTPDASVGPPGVDLFGFRDGISQPDPVEGLPPIGPGTHYAVDDKVRLGELLLGYGNDRGDDAKMKFGDKDWQRNSTFLVVRKIEQFPQILDQWVTETCDRLNQQHGLNDSDAQLTPRQLKEYLVGRKQDGTPMVPGASDNSFTFASDPAGQHCPLASHIRRTNPRSQSFDRPTARMMRRGMPFGPAAGDASGQEPRGLMFMAYVASIAEQYEVIQRWINGGNSTGIPSTHSDPLLGVSPKDGERHFQFWHAGRLMKCSIPATRIADPLLGQQARNSFTRLHYGLYLWVPARTALATMCGFPLDQIDMDAPLEDTGRAIIERISLLPDDLKVREWKRLLEDFDSKDMSERYLSPDVWSAIRWYHGGALKVERGAQQPALVLVGGSQLGHKILSDPATYSSCEQTDRMHDSFGLNYVTIDGGDSYWAESGVTNAIMFAQRAETGFTDGYRFAAQVLGQILEPARRTGLPQARFDIRRQWLMPTLGLLCQHWFGLPGSAFMDLGGLDFDPQRTRARCPGDFISSSRYIFNVEPSDELEAIGKHHGTLVRNASRAFVDAYRADPAALPGTLARLLFDAIDEPDLLARNLSGMMLGMLAPIEANLRGILFEWLTEQTLWRYQAAYFGAQHDPAQPDYAAARAALAQPILKAMSKRPAPDMLYRTVARDHILHVGGTHGRDIQVSAGDIVIVSLASITQRKLERGAPDASFIFGGTRTASGGCPYSTGDQTWDNADQADGYPLHACPARKLMTGAITGIVSALLGAGRIQAMPAGLVIGIDTGL